LGCTSSRADPASMMPPTRSRLAQAEWDGRGRERARRGFAGRRHPRRGLQELRTAAGGGARHCLTTPRPPCGLPGRGLPPRRDLRERIRDRPRVTLSRAGPVALWLTIAETLRERWRLQGEEGRRTPHFRLRPQTRAEREALTDGYSSPLPSSSHALMLWTWLPRPHNPTQRRPFSPRFSRPTSRGELSARVCSSSATTTRPHPGPRSPRPRGGPEAGDG
jgi:hypothetical protein